MAGFTTVAIFPTESADTIRYVLEHCEARLLFVGKLDAWDQQRAGVASDLPRIALPLSACIDCDTWNAIVGRTLPISARPQRGADDIALIAYTSGSTGQPKGVMHSFAGITRTAEHFIASLEENMEADQEIRALSYLPLAHVTERAYIECLSLVHGKTHLYFAESLDTFLQDLQRARPTIFISVPRLWIKFQQGVFAKMPEQKLNRLLRIPLIGKLVARKILKGLGLDHVVIAGSGSAPIPLGVLDWYRRLGLPLREGYGMTEDFAYSHRSTNEFNRVGYVGVPYPGVEVRISEDGEVQIKTPGLMVGYYKQPGLTAEAFTDDGYLKTGDLGERSADGMLKITGRMKELFKTGKGKYVAPAPIENKLNEHALVEMSIVSGVGQQSAYAIVVLAEDIRPKVTDSAVRGRIDAELAALLEQVNLVLPAYERLRMIVVSAQPWTIENGCLTPTMKIKRSRIEQSVSERVDRWFEAPAKVIWA